MTPDRLNKRFLITVAALTRRRPNMVNELIASWGQMDLPPNCDIRCLIVENDDHPLTQPMIKATPVLNNGITLDYVLETNLGIPFGRNRAAKEALERGDDLLVFVDDDETVAEDWLVKLVDGYRQSEAVLLGAPLRIAPPAQNLSPFQSLMYDNLRAFYERGEARTAKTATLHSLGSAVTAVATNNWIATTQIFKDENIWFDESLKFSGGEDTHLLREVQSRGFKVGWVKDAFAFETIPAARLSFFYQLRRSMDQANTKFQKQMIENPNSRYTVFLRIPDKLLELVFILVLTPFQRTRGPLKLARKAGIFLGKLGAAVGKRSSHYKTTTGH